MSPGAPRGRAGVVAGVLLLAAAAACGGGDDPASTTTTATTAPPSTEDGSGDGDHDADLVDVAGIDLSIAAADLPAGAEYEDWMSLTDDLDLLTVDVPAAWDDVDTTVGSAEGVDVPSIWVSTDLDALLEGYDAPGLKYALRSGDLAVQGADDWLAEVADINAVADACTGAADFAYDDGLYVGEASLWTDCGGAALLLIAAALPEGDGLLTLEVQMVSRADVDAAAEIIRTFRYLGDAGDVPTKPEAPSPTPAPTPAPAPSPDELGQRALDILAAHLAGCGMGWEDPDLLDTGGGTWEIAVFLLPGPGMGDPGEGIYWIDLGDGSVTSVNGTADVLCPG